MRDPDRINKLLRLVQWYWMENPDLRLGQLINNITSFAGSNYACMVEDDVLIEYLTNQHYEKLLKGFLAEEEKSFEIDNRLVLDPKTNKIETEND